MSIKTVWQYENIRATVRVCGVHVSGREGVELRILTWKLSASSGEVASQKLLLLLLLLLFLVILFGCNFI
jgi:hypothetical protein